MVCVSPRKGLPLRMVTSTNAARSLKGMPPDLFGGHDRVPARHVGDEVQSVESRRELHAKARAAERLRIKLYLCSNPISDLLDDRQAKSAAVSASLRAAPEALEDMIAMLCRDAGALIVDGQYSRRSQGQRDGSPTLRI